MCWENADKTYLYFVDSANNKLLKKVNTSTFVVSTVTTRTNKNIARGYPDRTANRLYLCDCEYDNTTSYIYYIDLSDDSVVEITSIPANVYDIWRYGNETHIIYFTTSYELLTINIDPTGDDSIEWDNSGAGANYEDIDEGSTPSTAEYIYAHGDNLEDIYTMEDIDLSAYDSGEVYDITCYAYAKGNSSSCKLTIDGDQIGMTAQEISLGTSYAWKTVVFSGLSLQDINVNTLKISLKNSSLTICYTGTSHNVTDTDGICWDGTYFYTTSISGRKVYKYNSSWVLQTTYDIGVTSDSPTGICWDGTNFFIVDRASKLVHKYDTSFNLIANFDLSGQMNYPTGICWDGTNFFVFGYLSNTVYKYASDWTYTGTSYNISTQTTTGNGLCWDGTCFWIFSSSNGYKYNSAWVYSGSNYILQMSSRDGIYLNGTYYICGTNETVYEYNNIDYIATMYCVISFYGDTTTELVIKNLDTLVINSQNMGVMTNRMWDISQVTTVGDQFYFLWKWSNENVELWHYDISGAAFTQDEDCGANTELAPIQQHAISYDNSDILYFTLGTGTKEISTIVAQVANNIDDEDYIVYYAIQWNAQTRVYSQKKYYLWFDKAGDSVWTADPLDGDVNIRIPITAGWTAQQVSDAIESAVNADGYITCDNAAGTTCTLTNDYCGACTNIADGAAPYATGLTLATTQAGVDCTWYLYTEVISTLTLTQKGTFSIALMLDRNTVSTNTPEFFGYEKALATALTASYELKLHQIARTRGGLNYLGKITLNSGDVGVAITDYYLIIYCIGPPIVIELWKFEDVMGTVIVECDIDAEERTWTSIDLIYIYKGAGYQDAPERDQLIQVFGRYSSYTLGAPYYGDNLLIAEGLVRNFNLDVEQEVRIESLAQEELAFAPNITSYTNYTGKTSGQVITQLLLDYCKTITAGTIVNGSITWTCPADWSVAGDKSIEVILNELADSENFSWRLRPNCKLDFDAGTVDSQRDFNPTDTYSNQEARLLSQQINQIIVYGGFVNGVQVGAYYANDTNHQLLYGNIVKWSKTYSGIFDATALQTIATNKLAIQGAKPLVYWADRYCTDWGFIQPGETIYLGGWYFGSPDSFWEQAVGDSGTNIAWVDSATLPNACSVSIIAGLDDHKNVLKLTHDGGASDPSIIHNITATTSTTYEWWWATSDVTKIQEISFRSSTTKAIRLQLSASKYYYWTVGGTITNEIIGDTPTNDIFDYFKLIFNCVTDKFDLYINNILRVNQGDFNNVVTSIDNIYVLNSSNAAYSQYISAPGDVADVDYDEGDNIVEHSRIKVSENSTQELPVGTYIVNRNKFDAKNNVSEVKISDGMLFLEDGSETLSEQNSELIQQLAVRTETKLSTIAGTINTLTEKTTIAATDVFLMEDSADSYAQKKVVNLPKISSGAGAPGSTPTKIGDIYIDTTNLNIYIAGGTGGSYSWGLVGKAQSSAFVAGTVAGLQVWLDAELGITKDGADLVSQWNDQSGNGNNCTSALTAKPLWVDNQINGLATIRFDGVNDYLVSAAFALNQPITVFLVLKVISSTGEDVWFDGLASQSIYEGGGLNTVKIYAGTADIAGDAFVDTTWYLFTTTFNGASSSIQVNTAAEDTGNPGATNAGGYILGSKRTYDYSANIEIAEVLVYDSDLSDANRLIVRTYLNNKYGLW